jgi:NADPH:quinone reductase-like Zn-dependent oxidoreductase
VREVGSEALKTHSFLQPGSPVFGLLFNPGSPDSALSTHVKIKPNSDHPCVLPLPSQLSFEEAASIPLVFVTVMTALCQYGLLDRLPSASNAKRSIAIVGASGGTGVYAVQVAKRLLGVGHVLGVCSRSNAEFLEGLGADDVLRYDEEDVVDGLRKRKPEGGWDVVLDLVGGRDVWDGFGPLASKDGGGFVTIVGDKTGRSEMGGELRALESHPARPQD